MAVPGLGCIERQLAAILAADVPGYSRLMGADEIGTARALRAPTQSEPPAQLVVLVI